MSICQGVGNYNAQDNYKLVYQCPDTGLVVAEVVIYGKNSWVLFDPDRWIDIQNGHYAGYIDTKTEPTSGNNPRTWMLSVIRKNVSRWHNKLIHAEADVQGSKKWLAHFENYKNQIEI